MSSYQWSAEAYGEVGAGESGRADNVSLEEEDAISGTTR